MDKGEALSRLRETLDEVPKLRNLRYDNAYYEVWCYKVMDILKAGFGPDSDEYQRFKQSVQPGKRSGTGGELQRWYNRKLSKRAAALVSIIQKYDLLEDKLVPAEGGENIKAELEQFHDELIRYKELVLAERKGTLPNEQQREFQTLSLDLQRKYGSLEQVIKEYGGPAVLPLQGGKYKCEVFREMFTYTRFHPETLAEVMNTAITTVNMAIGKLEKVLESKQLPQEAVYPSGKPYDAYKDIKDILTAATKKLIIVDPYVDSTLLTMLENVQPKVQIQILTRKMGGDFQLVGQKFKEQREEAQQGTLEVRKSGKLHDRFIVADNKVFHIGASIKDAGIKMSAMSEFEGSGIKTTLRKTIYRYWDEAEVVL